MCSNWSRTWLLVAVLSLTPPSIPQPGGTMMALLARTDSCLPERGCGMGVMCHTCVEQPGSPQCASPHDPPRVIQVASFYSWQPPVPPHELISRINQQLEAQWAAATTGPQQIATAGATCTNSVPNSSTSSASSSQDGQISSSTGALSGSPASPLGQQPPQAVQAPPVCPLRVWGAVGVPRQFHPTFGASWRRYVYLLPLRTQQPAGGWQLACSAGP